MHPQGEGGPYLARIRRFPIKSLDGESRRTATVLADSGAIAGDRRFAIVDGDGELINGKRTAAVHPISADFTEEKVTLESDRAGRITASLETDREAIATWLSNHFGHLVRLEAAAQGGRPDDTDRPGPTVISTGTIREIASWFPDIGPDNMRWRLRASLEIGGVAPFWEDRLYADTGKAVPFEIGGVRFHGVSPCPRCVVPTRDPETGEPTAGFRDRFIENRRATRPPWLDSDRYDHDYRVMVNTRRPAGSDQAKVAVGDPVTVAEPVPV